ncbi:hypothetical protein BC749_107242 [Flavobacterium araucananum]|nr:hypothetical protein BC749_107242 [Flavobacterium araucananum]
MLIIFCGMNMPIINGLELKRLIDADPVLRKKSIPLVFYSRAATQNAIEEAHTALSMPGFKKKENDCHKSKSTANTILGYWKSASKYLNFDLIYFLFFHLFVNFNFSYYVKI